MILSKKLLATLILGPAAATGTVVWQLNPGNITPEEVKVVDQLWQTVKEEVKTADANLDDIWLKIQGNNKKKVLIAVENAQAHSQKVLEETIPNFELAYAESYLYDVVVETPPPVDPPIDPPTTEEWPDPATFGYQGSTSDLLDWTFKPVSGAGRPAGVAAPVTGAIVENFYMHPLMVGDSTDRGLLSGVSDTVDDLTYTNGRVSDMKKWGANGHVRGVNFTDLTFTGSFPEHDIYVKLNGGGTGLYCNNILSIDTGSQALQVAKREWECVDFSGGGPIVVKNWYVINHGGGDRESQAWKVFSAQAGTSANQTLVQMPHTVYMENLWLDDSSRDKCMGALYIGDTISYEVQGLHAKGGHLEQSAIQIASGTGPVILNNLELFYTSAEEGRGIKLEDLNRPVTIHPGQGNIYIKGPDGEVLAHITEGYSQ